MNRKSMSEIVLGELGYEKVGEITAGELLYPRSEGHIAFVPDTHQSYWEYWEREGSIFRQSVHAPVMPDGYRSGRWYCTSSPEVIANLQRHVQPY